jgi:predicted extracellular nuclease
MKRSTSAARFVCVLAAELACSSGASAPASSNSNGCGAPGVAIADLRGGSAGYARGNAVSIEGAVTAVRTQPPEQAGFYVQAEPSAGAATEPGLFVVAGSAALPEPGERVRVRAQIQNVAGRVRLTALELLEHCGEARLEPEPIDAGVSSEWEERWVELRRLWTIVDTSELAASGRIRISDGGRLYAVGHELGTAHAAARLWTVEGLEANVEHWLAADQLSATLRLGAGSDALTGVLLSSSERRLLASGAPAFHAEAAPELRTRPERGVRVAALNLDNYFVSTGGRGAATPLELSRQRAKLISLLAALDADILALAELQNQGDDALNDLLDGLRARSPDQLDYRFEEQGDPGPDALRVGIAHRAARVSADGPARFASAPEGRRPPLLQSFAAGPLHFTLAVVHLKSKRCDGAPQLLSAEGCGAAERAEEVTTLLADIAALPAAQKDSVLLLGDFNSDPLEAPPRAVRAAGFVDLLQSTGVAQRYSYAFDGLLSQLDHAYASPRLSSAVQQAQIWHIDADEPRLLAYPLDSPSAAYHPDARRASDHDPVIVDLAAP